MEVRDAISAAKEYISQIYQDEGIFNIGLEEIQLNDEVWDVTIGFSRRWDRMPKSPFAVALGEPEDRRALHRTYKVVEVNDITGKIIGVRNRVGLM